MTITLAAIARDSWLRWRRDRETLLAVAGLFAFLPMLAWLLLVPEPAVPKGADQQQSYLILFDWLAGNLHWLALRVAFELYASAVVLTLYLSREHRDVRSLLRRGLVILPPFLVAVVASWGLIMVGAFAFIVPGLYVFGRVALTGPVIAAEPGIGFAEAITRSIALTRGAGWRVFGCLGLTIVVGALLVQIVGGIGDSLVRAGAASPIALAIVDAAAAAIMTAVMVARLLFEVSLYRRLAGPRHGI